MGPKGRDGTKKTCAVKTSCDIKVSRGTDVVIVEDASSNICVDLPDLYKEDCYDEEGRGCELKATVIKVINSGCYGVKVDGRYKIGPGRSATFTGVSGKWYVSC